jgi:hypothetical protein
MLIVGDAAYCAIRGFRNSGADEVVEVKGNGTIRNGLVPVGMLTRPICKGVELAVQLFLGADEVQREVYSVHETGNLLIQPVTRSETPNKHDVLN